MSHCSFLYTSDSSDQILNNSHSGAIEVCGACIPLFWLAMYSEGQVVARDIDYQAENLDAEEQYLAFVTPIELALQKLNRRKRSLLALIPEQFHEHLEEFIGCLRRATKRYVLVSIEEIESIGSESMNESAMKWSRILAGLDEPVTNIRPGVIRYLAGSGIPPSWRVLLASSDLATGWVVPKLRSPCEERQWVLCGADSASEIRSWRL